MIQVKKNSELLNPDHLDIEKPKINRMAGQYGETSKAGARRGQFGAVKSRKGENAKNNRNDQVQQSTTAVKKVEEEEDDDDDEVTERARLDISTNPLPPVEGLIEALSQLKNLQRLDMSDMKASEENGNPNGLETLQWMGKAVAKSKNRNKNNSSTFGQQLTWLKYSGNPSLGKYAGNDAWEGLDQFSKLTVLNASSCEIPVPPPSSTLLAWQSLGALVLGHNAITSIPHFPSMPQLNTIVLSHNQITSLPKDMPANLPGLKKLSITHNNLHWIKNQSPLPDFSLCSHLREVRISGNTDLKKLPEHISGWGKGVGKDSKGTGLEIFEAGDCGLDEWTSIAPLMQSNDDTQNEKDEETTDSIHPSRRKRVRGLITLSLRGNEVTKGQGYREKILELYPALRVLDSVKIQVDKKHEEEISTEVYGEKTKADQIANTNISGNVDSNRHKSTHNTSSSKVREEDTRGQRLQPSRKGEARESTRKYRKEDAISNSNASKGRDRDLKAGSMKERRLPKKVEDSHTNTTDTDEASRKKQHKRGGRGKKKKSTEEVDENQIKDPFLRSVDKSEKGKLDEDEHLARIRARAGPSMNDAPKKIKSKDSKAVRDSSKAKKTDSGKDSSTLDHQKSKKRKAWDEDAKEIESPLQNGPSKKSKNDGKDNDKTSKAEHAPKEVTSVAGVVNVAKKRNGEEKRKTKVPFNVAKKSDSRSGWGGGDKTAEPSIGLGGAWN